MNGEHVAMLAMMAPELAYAGGGWPATALWYYGQLFHSAYSSCGADFRAPAAAAAAGCPSSSSRKKSFTIEAILGRDAMDDGRASALRHPSIVVGGGGGGGGVAYATAWAAAAADANADDSDSGSRKNRKRFRTVFTRAQARRLEAEFARQQYMIGSERRRLADSLDLSEGQVKVWFQNRRIKWRRHNYPLSGAAAAAGAGGGAVVPAFDDGERTPEAVAASDDGEASSAEDA